MDSAQKTLIDIASASQRVINTLDRNIGRKTVESAQLDKIVVGSRTVLEALNKTLFFKDGNADDRLVDWLKGEEPQACVRTLNQMEEILSRKLEYGVKSFFKASRLTHTQDRNNEAIGLFQMRKSYFHFLFQTGIWNRESGTQQQPQDVLQLDILSIGRAIDERDLVPVIQCNSRDPLSVAQAGKGNTTKGTQRIKFDKLGGILEWLNAWKPRGTHDRTILLRQPDTCTWLPNTNAYKTWRSTENSFLWLHGKPGAGKSVLAASVIESLKDTLQDGEVLAYFYCDFREERSASAAEAMRSLLSQLLQHLHRQMVDPGDLLNELAEEKDEGASTTSNAMLLARHISRAAMQFPKQPLLVIDALDECKDIDVLLKALDGSRKGGIRLFVTSRPYQIIKQSLSAFPSIDLEVMSYWMSADIRLHITRELDSRRRLRLADASLKKEIYSKLCKQAGGMFRWVQCQLNTLDQCMTAVEIREALDNLPSDLDATYERIVLGIDIAKQGGKVTRRALDWLVVALQPLQLSQIMDGLSIDLGQRTIERDSGPFHGFALLDALGSLVMYDKVTDIVILSHFSVKEYLIAETTYVKYPAYHIDQQAAHAQTALLCMCYIGIYLRRGPRSGGYEALPCDEYNVYIRHENSNKAVSHSNKLYKSLLIPPDSHPLLEYALHSGFRHLAHVNPRKKNGAILRAVKDFHSDAEQHHLKWKQLCEEAKYFRDCYIPPLALRHDLALSILIAFAPEPLLRSFIGHTSLQPKDGTNPLIYASYFDKIEHAKTLLSKGADVNSRGWDVWESHQVLPLEVAVRYDKDPAMVDLFLGEGSRVPHKLFVDALMNDSCFFTGRIVSRLLQTDEFVEWAAEVEDEELLRALDQKRYGLYRFRPSEQDIDVIERRLVQLGCNLPPRWDEASLRYAVYEGHVSTVRHMLSLNVSFPSDIILDASHSIESNSTMIRILLDMGCQVDVTSSTGDTPLHLVLKHRRSEEDCFESVQLLVDAGCNPSAHDLAGDVPVCVAAARGYVSVVEYLLSLRVPLPPDILLVVSGATVTTIRLLIRHGADVHAIAANGDTPLHSVVGRTNNDESLACAGFLVDAGCNPRLPNATGKTAFDVAAEMGHLSIVQHLLSINVPLPPTILLWVVDRLETAPLIKLLIDKGADVRATRLNGDTLLHLVMDTVPEAECLKRVKILVNAGCNPRACNLRGRTPFHVAARQRYISVMEYLLSLGTPVPPDVMLTLFERINYPQLPRYYPATRFLLDKGGGVHTISEAGDTLLHLAVAILEPEHDILELTKFLVHAGCNPATPNLEHKTPLHITARGGYITVIDYYLSLDISLSPDILLDAVQGRSSERPQLIRYLIEKGADTSATTTDGDTPLHLVVTKGKEDGHLACVKILIHAGCDPRARNFAGEAPLHAAARHRSISVVKYLLSQGVPLPHDILRTSAPSMFRFLISRGADVRCSAATVYMQLIHRALDFPYEEEDCLECAKILVGAGWDPTLRNAAGEFPIHIAARHAYISVIRYLYSQGASIPPDVLLAVSGDGFNPHTGWALTCFLIRVGADVNAATSDGDTSLHHALRSRFILSEVNEVGQMEMWKVVKILLDGGADPSTRNADGQTPIDIAEANGHFFKENFLRLVRKAHCVRSAVASTSG